MSTLTVSVGPQHPGSGHFRIIITLDGDIIVDAQPDPGYVHRGSEKLAEYRNYIQNIPHFERSTCLQDASGVIYPYVLAVEELLNVKPPERAEYIRAIMAEMNRLISHLYWLAIMGIFLGHSTMFLWAMGDREVFIDLAQMTSGARVTFSHIVPGGVRTDLPDGFKEKTLRYIEYFEKRLLEYERIFFTNPLFLERTQGVGVLRRQDAIELGVVGPTLRASGVKSDTRKDEPYGIYEELDFEIPVMDTGDSYARCMIPLFEMKQSLNIIRQALEKMRPGPVKLKLHPAMRIPAGEAYGRCEAARGALAYYLVGDGSPKPHRLKVSTPSFRNLAALPHVLKGYRLADVPVIYWSLNYWPVEADR